MVAVLSVPACFVVITVLTVVVTFLILADRPRKLPRATWNLHHLASDLTTYRLVTGHYPTTEQGLRALVEEPISEPRPKRWIQLIKEVPRDQWGNEYVYAQSGAKTAGGYELLSKGPDGVAGTADDIIWDVATARARSKP